MLPLEVSSVKSIFEKLIVIPLVVVLAIILSPILIGYFLYMGIMKVYVRLRLARKWPSEKCILFIYSESENWSPYIQEHIIPRIESSAVIINRTTQQNWKQEYVLEKRALELWASIEHNPVAIIFGRKSVKAFLFFEGFRDLKHGKESKLLEICDEFYNYAGLSDINRPIS